MTISNIPYYGKDTDRLAMLGIAYKAFLESGSFLENWPLTVANITTFKDKIDTYQSAYEGAIHLDRRFIAQRIAACNDAGVTWQKIVNYACATIEDNTALLELMGVATAKSQRTSLAKAPAELLAPDFMVVNLDPKGAVRASCSRERRRYTYEVWFTEGDPRVEEGWSHKKSFGDCAKMDMEGLQSGKEYSFRCRIIGRDNAAGPWSHTLTMVVT